MILCKNLICLLGKPELQQFTPESISTLRFHLAPQNQTCKTTVPRSYLAQEQITWSLFLLKHWHEICLFGFSQERQGKPTSEDWDK